jgi:hypothetical protein
MPPPASTLPYKRPFFNMTLSPHEIEVCTTPGGAESFRSPLGAVLPVACRISLLQLSNELSLLSQEDLALIITNTKRRRRASPSADHRGRMDRD